MQIDDAPNPAVGVPGTFRSEKFDEPVHTITIGDNEDAILPCEALPRRSAVPLFIGPRPTALRRQPTWKNIPCPRRRLWFLDIRYAISDVEMSQQRWYSWPRSFIPERCEISQRDTLST